MKGKVGIAGVVPKNAPQDLLGAWTAGQSFIIARLRQSSPIIDPAVLARYLASSFGQSQMQALAGGTTVPLIPMADPKSLPVPVPPVEKQREILTRISEIESLRDQMNRIAVEIEKRHVDLSNLFFQAGVE